MKKIFLFSLAVFAIALFLVAPQGFVLAQINQADINVLFSNYTLIITVFIGVSASIATLYFAFQMRGSVLGNILNAFSLGMLLVILGFLSSSVIDTSKLNLESQKLIHDALFVTGYISMLLGAIRMRKLKV